MKRTKRIFAIFMTLALAMSMLIVSSAVSFAATATDDGYSVTITNNSTDKATHTYEAYQIFAGKLAADGKTLTNITWGDGIDSSKLGTLAADINALRNQTAEGYVALTADSSASKFAEAIAELKAANDDAKAQALATAFSKALSGNKSGVVSGNTVSKLPAGYYLFKDKDASLANAENSAYTRFILKVSETVTVEQKASVPEVKKEVKDTNDTEGVTSDWQKSADYDIGDAVPFKLTATTASTVSDYVKYHVTFQDKQSAGLDAPESYKITVLGKELTLAADATTAVSAVSDGGTKITAEKVTADSGYTFAIKVTLENNASTEAKVLKNIAETNSTTIVVEYNSELNNNAVYGATGNPNEVYLKYSNNPNSSDDTEEGKVPKDEVIVFTYKTVFNKVDEKKDPLAGAEFTLNKKLKDGGLKPIAVVKNEAGTSFTFKGLDDGTYVLKETKTPDGYNTIDDVEFTITANHDATKKDSSAYAAPSVPATQVFELKYDANDNQLEADIVNQKGATLPSTGGIGTVIFYVLGSLLVVGCGIVLISKRRMESR